MYTKSELLDTQFAQLGPRHGRYGVNWRSFLHSRLAPRLWNGRRRQRQQSPAPPAVSSLLRCSLASGMSVAPASDGASGSSGASAPLGRLSRSPRTASSTGAAAYTSNSSSTIGSSAAAVSGGSSAGSAGGTTGWTRVARRRARAGIRSSGLSAVYIMQLFFGPRRRCRQTAQALAADTP